MGKHYINCFCAQKHTDSQVHRLHTRVSPSKGQDSSALFDITKFPILYPVYSSVFYSEMPKTTLISSVVALQIFISPVKKTSFTLKSFDGALVLKWENLQAKYMFWEQRNTELQRYIKAKGIQ